MSVAARLDRLGRWLLTQARLVTRRLGLTWQGWCVLAAGILALGAAVAVLAGVSEDVTQHNGLASSDPAHLRFFTDHRPDLLVHASRIVTELGNAAVVAIIAIAAGLVLWRRGLPVVVAAAPAIAFAIAAVIGDLAKRLVDRGRPPVSLRLIVEGEPSFPSGHATNAAAVYLTLGLVLAVFVLKRPLVRVAVVAGAAVLAGVVGASRLVLGVHWPSDVLAGWALGAVVAFAVTMATALLVGLMPRNPAPPPSRLQRVAVGIGRFLTLERRRRTRRGLQAA
jgi:membrane-associated phospholipid phosphatase